MCKAMGSKVTDCFDICEKKLAIRVSVTLAPNSIESEFSMIDWNSATLLMSRYREWTFVDLKIPDQK